MQAFSVFFSVVFALIVFVSIILDRHLLNLLKIIIIGIEFSFEAMIYLL